MSSMLAPRLLSWGMTSAGLGLGLVVAAFVGEDTPMLALWGGLLVGAGTLLMASHYLIRRRNGHGQR